MCIGCTQIFYLTLRNPLLHILLYTTNTLNFPLLWNSLHVHSLKSTKNLLVSLRSDCTRTDCDSLSHHLPNSTVRLDLNRLDSTLLLSMHTHVRQVSVDDKLCSQIFHHTRRTKYTFFLWGRFEPLILVSECQRARSPDSYLEPWVGQM
jgi:hypothetical protein